MAQPVGDDAFTEDNAEFIAHAREDVPWLVADNEQLAAERDQLRAENARLRTELEQLKADVAMGDHDRGE